MFYLKAYGWKRLLFKRFKDVECRYKAVAVVNPCWKYSMVWFQASLLDWMKYVKKFLEQNCYWCYSDIHISIIWIMRNERFMWDPKPTTAIADSVAESQSVKSSGFCSGLLSNMSNLTLKVIIKPFLRKFHFQIYTIRT